MHITVLQKNQHLSNLFFFPGSAAGAAALKYNCIYKYIQSWINLGLFVFLIQSICWDRQVGRGLKKIQHANGKSRCGIWHRVTSSFQPPFSAVSWRCLNTTLVIFLCQKLVNWGWVKTLVPCREPQVIAGVYGCE